MWKGIPESWKSECCTLRLCGLPKPSGADSQQPLSLSCTKMRKATLSLKAAFAAAAGLL
ncbi:hypothetical protein P7K49_012331 [Saguinus oedipus]|uniref:Uncharacterized protein n=1 Tax=Saguinus oedipus TaxID=9490 RepID=A0ABQ9VUR0_SAGOE|nr:hypothetical protein P7K49_012331 [Saguinus oedipus]